MRILLSAYACEPGKGSEPGVGWHWALETARLGHEVWVLTRANNRSAIEAALAQRPPMHNLRFCYYDLPAWARWWKKGRRGIRLYCILYIGILLVIVLMWSMLVIAASRNQIIFT